MDRSSVLVEGLVALFFALLLGEQVIYKSIILGLLSGQEEVAFGILGNLVNRFTGVLRKDFVELRSHAENFFSLNLDIGDLTSNTTVRLVHHDGAVGQAKSLAGRSPCQQDRATAGRLADAVGRHRAGKHLHGVVDGQRRNDFTTRGIDVEVDVFAAILALQIKQLHHHFVGIAGVNLSLEKYDSVLQKKIPQRHLTLALVALVRVRIKHWRHVWKVTQLIFPLFVKWCDVQMCTSFRYEPIWQGYLSDGIDV